MLLTTDIGNSNIVFAIYEGNKLVDKWRIATDSRKTYDEYFTAFEATGKARKWYFTTLDINGAIISSVVPSITLQISLFIKKYLSIKHLFIIGHDNLDYGIDIKLDNPKELGADRIVNALAAYNKYQQDLIVIDFGTATTFDVIIDNDIMDKTQNPPEHNHSKKRGQYIGGAIAPGINLSVIALEKAAAKLPMVEIRNPGKVIGKSTISAIESGIFYGYVSLIEGMVKRIQQEHGKKMLVIATGGLAHLFKDAVAEIEIIEEDLNINGLQELYLRQFYIGTLV